MIEGSTRRRKSRVWKSSTPAPKPTADRIVANGGRVLNICARGKTVREAQPRAYAAIDHINWPDGFFRHDIGWRAVRSAKKH